MCVLKKGTARMLQRLAGSMFLATIQQQLLDKQARRQT
jgi:hypothetical protein